LESKNNNLQSIVNLSQSSVEVDSVTVNEGPNAEVQVAAFGVNYAGYIVVSGTSTTSNGYVAVYASFEPSVFREANVPFPTAAIATDSLPCYSFGTSNQVIIPVLPGGVILYFGNTNPWNGAGATATITVTYYY